MLPRFLCGQFSFVQPALFGISFIGLLSPSLIFRSDQPHSPVQRDAVRPISDKCKVYILPVRTRISTMSRMSPTPPEG